MMIYKVFYGAQKSGINICVDTGNFHEHPIPILDRFYSIE